MVKCSKAMEEYAKKTNFYLWMTNHYKLFHVILSLYYVSILNILFCTQIMCNKFIFIFILKYFLMSICKFCSFSKEVVDISYSSMSWLVISHFTCVIVNVKTCFFLGMQIFFTWRNTNSMCSFSNHHFPFFHVKKSSSNMEELVKITRIEYITLDSTGHTLVKN